MAGGCACGNERCEDAVVLRETERGEGERQGRGGERFYRRTLLLPAVHVNIKGNMYLSVAPSSFDVASIAGGVGSALYACCSIHALLLHPLPKLRLGRIHQFESVAVRGTR